MRTTSHTPSDADDILADGLEGPHLPPSLNATRNPAPCEKEGGQCVPATSIYSLIGALGKVWPPREGGQTRQEEDPS